MTSRRAENGREGEGRGEGEARRTEAAAKTTLTEIIAHLQQIHIYNIYIHYIAWCEKSKKSATLELWCSCNKQQTEAGAGKGHGEAGGGKAH